MSAAWRTLLVDDAADVRWIVRTLLGQDPAFELVGEAADGAAGLAMIRRLHPDLVLLDLAMPVMDGLEVLEALGSDSAGPTVVVLSGFAAALSSATVLKAGATAYLEKRDLVESLLPNLRGLLAGRRCVRAGHA